MLSVRRDPLAQPALLRQVPRCIHACVAATPSVERRAAAQRQRAQLRQRVPTTWQAQTQAVREVRRATRSKAPSGLRAAVACRLVVSKVPL